MKTVTRHRWAIWLAVTSALLCAAPAAALEARLAAADDSGTARSGGTVSGGVPFAKGAVKDLAKLSVTVAGKKVPAQFREPARWDDGSVRWALLDCLADVPAGGKVQLVLRDDGGNPAPAAPARADVTDAAATVSTGPMEVRLERKTGNFISSVKVDGRELVTAKSGGLVLYTAGELKTETPVDAKGRKGRPVQVRAPGKAVPAAPPTEVKVEEAGPVKTVLLLRGAFPVEHKAPVTYTVRLTAWAGAKFLKARVWLENGGAHGFTRDEKKGSADNEWFAFDGLAAELDLDLGGEIGAACEGAGGKGKFKVYQYCRPAAHYSKPAYGYANMEYAVTGGAEPKKGATTEGVTELSCGKTRAVAALRHFWENYEKAIELDGRTLKLWLWPVEGQWPRAFEQHSAPGYATSHVEPLRLLGVYNLPGSVHKSCELILDFSGRPAAESAAELSRPLFPAAEAEYAAATEAAPILFAPPGTRTGDADCDRKLAAWERMALTAVDPKGEAGIPGGRRAHACKGNAFDDGYWHGWMDFGDIPNPSGAYTSLGYGWLQIMCMNLLRTGKTDCLRLADEMARHRTEVDQQWSDREAIKSALGFQRPGYAFLQFHCGMFNRGFPGPAGTDLAGPVCYYLLTGDAKTREAIDRCAPRLGPGWEEIFKSQDYGVRQITGHMGAVSGAIANYCAMHVLTGDKQWLELALGMFKRCVLAKAKGCGPHLHERQQIRSQDYTEDDIKYCYAIATLCQMHRLTGDAEVLKLIQAGCEAEFPENFFDAPLYLADLHAYAALVTGKAGYADDAVEHWIQASPESESPPVFLLDNSTWSREKAMHLRTGHLLQYYFWKKGAKK
jgi:hypothetical protein